MPSRPRPRVAPRSRRPSRRDATPNRPLNKDVSSGLAGDWWKDIPWKADSPAALELSIDSARAPSRFSMADIAFDRVTKDADGFNAALALIQSALDEDAGITDPREFLEGFEFERTADGGYEVSFAPKASAPKPPTRPRKIADLTSVTAGMFKAVGWDVLAQGLGLLAGLIPIPVVKNLVKEPISRFFRFREELYLQHEAMAQEAVDTAEEGTPIFSPYSSLTKQERALSAKSLYLANSSLSSVWEWIFIRPEKTWRKAMAKDAKLSAESLGWLQGNQDQIDALNPRYVVARQPDSRRFMYVLPRARLFKKTNPPRWRSTISIRKI